MFGWSVCAMDMLIIFYLLIIKETLKLLARLEFVCCLSNFDGGSEMADPFHG